MVYSRNVVVPEPEHEFLTSELGYEREGSAIQNDATARYDAPRIERQHDPSDADFLQHLTQRQILVKDATIESGDVPIKNAPTTPKPFFKQPVKMPRWLLLLIANGFVLLLMASFSVVFVFKLSKVGHNQSCLQDSDCNSNVGLTCTAGTCSCGTVEIWNGHQCIPQRTYNRTCKTQDDCDSLSKLVCMNVTIGTKTDSLCWCSNFRYWLNNECVNLKTFNTTCSSNVECDHNDYLRCISGRCDCNSTQFWNNEFCENKRVHGGQCFSTYWCNSATSGLQCSTWEPTAGTCDCLPNRYWWSANQTCLPELPMNATCTFDYQCNSNQSLVCSSTTSPSSCQCNSQSWYNSTKCVAKLRSGAPCTSSRQCDDTLSLTCNLTTNTCSCNISDYVWDGSQCVVRRTIGGSCTTNAQCLAYQNLTCATSGILNGTCVCPTNSYWNTAISRCVAKKLWNSPCATSYECYDGGALSCQPSAAFNATVCDCQDYTYYWTGFLNNTYSGYCTPKINYGVPSFTCVSSYQCRDYNYITCISGQCTCNFTTQYWGGTSCEPRLNYSYPCNSTSMCRNWPSGPNLQCLIPPGGSIKQCLCNPTEYFDYCNDRCYTARSWNQTCNTSSCYATDMCDQTRSLSCISNICSCSNTQWWNTTACLAKGTYLDSCTTGEHYQCQQYNLLSCVASQCQCGSTMYWSSSANACISKRSYLGACASTNECLTSVLIGLSCVSGQCRCTGGQLWNSVAQQCDSTG